ncbi:hypothetical protein GP2_024_00160 [Gordonia paraffinivorans NBRC 108238]|uniref:Secreted protein n=1 Tax=Gordonia paraffinivorans NBRC 108238 TaxID=1223543 RepID=A0ABQ0ILZ1_9ACTN|nr:hypothetical protein [Gordonia paraffinivorans]GAC84589.1 hypothetical protein GP2_024_00160 [Gordonia paraffinivorans NBRC 108238]
MTYLFAVVGLLAIGFLLWRAFGPRPDDAGNSPSHVDMRNRKPRPLGPDDDPDFLRDLDNRTQDTNGGDTEEP